MTTLYRKTDKGLAERETREFGLSPRMRQALNLVDGRKTEADLRKLIVNAPGFTLSALLAEGFIEVVRTAADRPLETVAAPRPAPAASVAVVKREAARFLIDMLGTAAEPVAVQFESAKSLPELQSVLAGTARTLRSLGSDALADEFIARFVTPLQGAAH